MFSYLVGSGFLWEPDELGETQQNEALPLGATMFWSQALHCNYVNANRAVIQCKDMTDHNFLILGERAGTCEHVYRSLFVMKLPLWGPRVLAVPFHRVKSAHFP